MKVILTKDCKDGKANTIIEVSDGYGTNFLVRKGFAMPYNKNNLAKLQKILDNLEATEHENRKQARALQEQLENIVLRYTLEATIDKNKNLNVSKSVSSKHIKKELAEKGFKLHEHAISQVKLVSEGSHDVKIVLYKDIVANLRVEIKINVIRDESQK